MADNVTRPASAGGPVIATDDIGGIHHQLVKLEYGAADSATQVSPVTPLPQTDCVEGKTFKFIAFDWSSAQTAVAVWTPASTKKFVITDIVAAANAGSTITLFDTTSAGTTNNLTTRVLKVQIAASGQIQCNYRRPYQSATADNVLKITTATFSTGFLMVEGYEV